MEERGLKEQFLKLFPGSQDGVRLFYAPGRVNLIGEHTDYNGGYVFPCALSFGTYAVARKRDDRTLRFASTNFDLKIIVSLDDLKYDREHDWANYPKGVIKMFQEDGFPLGGLDVLFHGNIPNGAGLSSSASIELATSVMLNGLFDCGVDMIHMVKLSQNAENLFVGVNCGIMDQFSIGMGKEGHAILLNCRTLEYEHVPLKMDGYKLVITNTNKRRGLTDSKYNERRSECEKAVEYLKKEINIDFLGQIDGETFEKYRHLIEDDVVLKRASHVVYEDERTLRAVKRLREGDIKSFGELMSESHKSLRDLYEVTGLELDTLAEEAWKVRGVLGSRMTGAGFGGCTVSVVKEEAVDEFMERVGRNYKERVGLTPDFYIGDIGDGAREIKLP